MMIESKDRVDVRSRLDQCDGESIHIGELLIMKATNHLSNSKFHLGVWIYYLKEALIFQRILQGEPPRSFPIANMITDPGKRLGHNSPGGDTKRHRSQALVECDSSAMMALFTMHQIYP